MTMVPDDSYRTGLGVVWSCDSACNPPLLHQVEHLGSADICHPALERKLNAHEYFVTGRGKGRWGRSTPRHSGRPQGDPESKGVRKPRPPDIPLPRNSGVTKHGARSIESSFRVQPSERPEPMAALLALASKAFYLQAEWHSVPFGHEQPLSSEWKRSRVKQLRCASGALDRSHPLEHPPLRSSSFRGDPESKGVRKPSPSGHSAIAQFRSDETRRTLKKPRHSGRAQREPERRGSPQATRSRSRYTHPLTKHPKTPLPPRRCPV